MIVPLLLLIIIGLLSGVWWPAYIYGALIVLVILIHAADS